MRDLDLRKLRYFVAVAEELHFGRAAERLHIAQPVLSRQIRALEDELRAQLFERTKRATELTPAGRQLLDDARPLLAAADATRRRGVQAARGSETFTIGLMPGLTVTEAVRAFSAAHPEIEVELIRTTWNDQVDVLHDGRADVSIVRLPIDQAGLTVRPLFEEPRVAMLASDHRLAGKPVIDITDLADEHLLQDPDAVPEWRDIALELRTRTAKPIPVMRSVEEKPKRVPAARGISIPPLPGAPFTQPPAVASPPDNALPPTPVSPPGVPARRSRLIHDFAVLAGTVDW